MAARVVQMPGNGKRTWYATVVIAKRWWHSGALACLTALSGERHARASDSWLRVDASPECVPTQSELARRIESSIAGTPRASLLVEVQFTDRLSGTEARIRLGSGSRWMGTKHLITQSCEETTEAVVLVVALALSSDTTPLSISPGSSEDRVSSRTVSAPESIRTKVPLPLVRPEDSGTSMPMPDAEATADSGRWFSGAALHHDSFADTLALIGVGAATMLGRGELRGAVWYGFASESIEDAQQAFIRERSDFGAASLSYCYGVDEQRWVLGCGGMELGVTHFEREQRDMAGFNVKENELRPNLRSYLGSVFAYRGSAIQPELQLSAGILTAGSSKDAIFALRAGLGAAVTF